MKKIIYLTLCLLVGNFVLAQTNLKIDNRLFEKYDKEYLESLKANNPDELEYLNYSLDHSFYISPMPKEKSGASEISGEIEIVDENNISLTELNINIIENNYQYFIIKGKSKLLVVKSKEHILEEMKKNK